MLVIQRRAGGFKSNVLGIFVLGYFLISSFYFYGCNSGSNISGDLDKGVIVYDVDFENVDDGFSGAMMPSEIKTYVLNGMTATLISAGMGLVETKVISNPIDKEYQTLVSAMGQKIALVMNEQQVIGNFQDRVALELTYTGIEKKIAGVNCKEVVVRDSTDNVYSVFYCDAFSIDNPNWGTPFHEINGVLMEYSMKFGDAVMNLKANRILEDSIKSDFFEVPDDYEIITDPSQLEFIL
jgi:hypothetical protein